MIRRPDRKDFEDSATVKAVRGAQHVAEAGRTLVWTVGMLLFIPVSLAGLALAAEGLADIPATLPTVILGLGPVVLVLAGLLKLIRVLLDRPAREQAFRQIDECGVPSELPALQGRRTADTTGGRLDVPIIRARCSRRRPGAPCWASR
jgi:hypothetical protein